MTSPRQAQRVQPRRAAARVLLERLGWTYVPRETRAAEPGNEREVLLKGRLRAAFCGSASG